MSPCILVSLSFLALACPSAGAGGEQLEQSGGALHKVVEMLTGMADHAKQEKQDDEISISAFNEWCNGEEKELQTSIDQELSRMDSLEAAIAKLQVRIRNLGAEISEHQSDLAKYEAELKQNTAQRKKDHAEFVAASRDFMESIDSIERATASLEKQSFDRAGSKAALIQVSESTLLPQNAKSMLQAFASLMDADYESDKKGDRFSAPEANAYEFQSGGVIDMLKKLSEDFNNKLNEKQKEEMNAKHASDMVVTDLQDSIQNARKSIEQKTVQESKDQQAQALAKKELNEETKEASADKDSLKLTKASCFEKQQAHEEKARVLVEEIEAIEHAVAVLQDPTTTTGAKHLTLAQTNKKASAFGQFLNNNAGSTKSEGVGLKLRRFVEKRARQLGSRNLAMLAETIEASEKMADPFDKIRKNIKAQIKRLQEEGNEDSRNEEFCDKELARSKITRNKLTEDIDALQSAIDETDAEIIQMQEDLAKLSTEIAELQSAMAKAATLRHEESAKNKATVKEMVASERAVAHATDVLKQFYSTSLVQLKSEEKDPRQVEQAGGVLALLETIMSDFSNSKADAIAHESEAARSYSDFMSEAKINMATKVKAQELDDQSMVELKSKLQHSKGDLKATEKQVMAAERVHKSLQPQCGPKGPSYAERQAARKAELQSLAEAMGITTGL